ncbi:hypothetical protein GCM10010965_14250 [Caldalkalibacillus thermarum]|nr:hypothetical protein GCM10010965_14250 [Caldalkalibacillus thermarum]
MHNRFQLCCPSPIREDGEKSYMYILSKLLNKKKPVDMNTHGFIINFREDPHF